MKPSQVVDIIVPPYLSSAIYTAEFEQRTKTVNVSLSRSDGAFLKFCLQELKIAVTAVKFLKEPQQDGSQFQGFIDLAKEFKFTIDPNCRQYFQTTSSQGNVDNGFIVTTTVAGRDAMYEILRKHLLAVSRPTVWAIGKTAGSAVTNNLQDIVYNKSTEDTSLDVSAIDIIRKHLNNAPFCLVPLVDGNFFIVSSLLNLKKIDDSASVPRALSTRDMSMLEFKVWEANNFQKDMNEAKLDQVEVQKKLDGLKISALIVASKSGTDNQQLVDSKGTGLQIIFANKQNNLTFTTWFNLYCCEGVRFTSLPGVNNESERQTKLEALKVFLGNENFRLLGDAAVEVISTTANIQKLRTLEHTSLQFSSLDMQLVQLLGRDKIQNEEFKLLQQTTTVSSSLEQPESGQRRGRFDPEPKLSSLPSVKDILIAVNIIPTGVNATALGGGISYTIQLPMYVSTKIGEEIKTANQRYKRELTGHILNALLLISEALDLDDAIQKLQANGQLHFASSVVTENTKKFIYLNDKDYARVVQWIHQFQHIVTVELAEILAVGEAKDSKDLSAAVRNMQSKDLLKSKRASVVLDKLNSIYLSDPEDCKRLQILNPEYKHEVTAQMEQTLLIAASNRGINISDLRTAFNVLKLKNELGKYSQINQGKDKTFIYLGAKDFAKIELWIKQFSLTIDSATKTHLMRATRSSDLKAAMQSLAKDNYFKSKTFNLVETKDASVICASNSADLDLIQLWQADNLRKLSSIQFGAILAKTASVAIDKPANSLRTAVKNLREAKVLSNSALVTSDSKRSVYLTAEDVENVDKWVTDYQYNFADGEAEGICAAGRSENLQTAVENLKKAKILLDSTIVVVKDSNSSHLFLSDPLDRQMIKHLDIKNKRTLNPGMIDGIKLVTATSTLADAIAKLKESGQISGSCIYPPDSKAEVFANDEDFSTITAMELNYHNISSFDKAILALENSERPLEVGSRFAGDCKASDILYLAAPPQSTVLGSIFTPTVTDPYASERVALSKISKEKLTSITGQYVVVPATMFSRLLQLSKLPDWQKALGKVTEITDERKRTWVLIKAPQNSQALTALNEAYSCLWPKELNSNVSGKPIRPGQAVCYGDNLICDSKEIPELKQKGSLNNITPFSVANLHDEAVKVCKTNLTKEFGELMISAQQFPARNQKITVGQPYQPGAPTVHASSSSSSNSTSSSNYPSYPGYPG